MRTRASWMALVSCFCVVCLPGLVLPKAAFSQAAEAVPPIAELRAKLSHDLDQIASGLDGAIGIAVKDLAGGESFFLHGDTVFPQASSIKIPILLELLRQAQAGTLRLDERIEVKRAQAVGGSGVLQHFGDGTSALSVRDLAVLMIVVSDNTATNLLIDRVGLENVNDTLKRLGLRQTRLQRRMLDLAASRAGRENLSTPREMAALLELLHQGKVLEAKHAALALEILKYPKDTPLRRGLPAAVELADKPGEMPGVSCDSGVVLLAGRPYAISVMTTYVRDHEAAARVIAEVSRRVYAYFERLAPSNSYGVRPPL